MTGEALKKLTMHQKSALYLYSEIIEKARRNGKKGEVRRKSRELRNFLECLCKHGAITETEVELLYNWLVEKDRS